MTTPGARVAVGLPHGPDAIAATLGVLVSGRILLNADAQLPAARVIQQLAHAETALLVSGRAIAGWDGPWISPAAAGNCHDRYRRTMVANAGQRAVLQFTSGSTGAPRAVVWSHATLTRAADHLQQMFGFVSEDRHALLTPLTVASALAQVLAVLRAGAELHLCEARKCDAGTLGARLREGITTLQTIPSVFRMLARSGGGLGPSLRAIKLGGEPVTPLDARLFVEHAPDDAFLINGLGVTEAGFNVCWQALRK